MISVKVCTGKEVVFVSSRAIENPTCIDLIAPNGDLVSLHIGVVDLVPETADSTAQGLDLVIARSLSLMLPSRNVG